MKEHYVRLYRRHQLQIKQKFQSLGDTRFFRAELYDNKKFKHMAAQFDLPLKDTEEQVSHVTPKKLTDVLTKHPYLY